MDSISKNEIDKAFGEILRDFRKKYNLTQEQIAEEIGISLKYISRIENGKGGISTETLIKYVNFLGISPNTMYKDFIQNETVKKQIDLSEKLNDLSDDKLNFIYTIIELLKNLNS